MKKQFFLIFLVLCFTVSKAQIQVLEPIFCNGDSTASLMAIPSWGIGPYTYLWNTGDTTQIIRNLSAGNYSVIITDVTATDSVFSLELTQPSPIIITVGIIVPSDCDGHNNGAVNITDVSGGIQPYSFLWREINFDSVYTTQNITNVRGGMYEFTVTDDWGCTRRDTIVIPNINSVPLLDTIQDFYVCNGSFGSVYVQAAEASPGNYFTYSWKSLYNTGSFTSNDSVFGVSTQFMGSVQGIPYTMTITRHSDGCAFYNDFTITESATPLTVTPIVTHNTCYYDQNGSIMLQVYGGDPKPGYHVQWTGPNGFTSTSFHLSGLAVGDYIYTVWDDSVCSVTGTIRIEPLSPIQGYLIKKDITCNGYHDGTITAIYSGGTGYLQYLWSNGATVPYLDSLSPGMYTLMIIDSVGCFAFDSVLITQPSPITIVLDSLNHIQCNGGNDGEIWLTTFGGNSSLQYSWLYNGNLFPQITEDILHVPAGLYTVRVRDSLNCMAVQTFVLNEPLPTLFIDSVRTIRCNNGNDGYWAIKPVGIDTPYVCIFSTGDTISTDTIPMPFISRLSAGTYSVTVISVLGCSWKFEKKFEQPLPITVGLADIRHVYCKYDSTGLIRLDQVYGGTGPYRYFWSNGKRTNPITNIPAGIYHVTITDAKNCFIRETYEVHEPFEPIKFFATIQHTSCWLAENGQITLDEKDIFHSPYQNYFSLYDSIGHLIDSVHPGQTINNLASGKYIGVVTNQWGCTAKDTLIVEKGSEDCLFVPNLVTPNGDGYNDVFRVERACGYDDFEIRIFTDWGKQVYQSSDCLFTWDPLTSNVLSNTVYYCFIRLVQGKKVYQLRKSINIQY